MASAPLLYVVNLDAPEHARARVAIDAWRDGAEYWCTTWSVLYEFLRVSTHRTAFRRPLSAVESWHFVDGLLASTHFTVLTETDRHADVVHELVAGHPWLAGNAMHDLHIVAVMKEHGISEIRTADSGFHRFKFLRVVNPLLE